MLPSITGAEVSWKARAPSETGHFCHESPPGQFPSFLPGWDNRLPNEFAQSLGWQLLPCLLLWFQGNHRWPGSWMCRNLEERLPPNNKPCKLNSKFLTSRPWLIWRRTLLSMNVWSFSGLTTAISKAGSKIWNKNKYTVAIPELYFVLWKTSTHSVWAKAHFSHVILEGSTSRKRDDLLERTAALA